MPGPYDEVVSLGRSCQAAHQLRHRLGLDRAHVFDWLITTDRGLLYHIDTRLSRFFYPDTLVPDDNGGIRDRITGTRFPHEFPRGAAFGIAYAKAAPRIFALARRWTDLMASDQSVLFIRHHGWHGDIPSCARRLHEALRGAAPRLRFRLLYLSAPDRFQPLPDEPGLLHRPLAQPADRDWRGLDSAWQALFDEALALPPPPGPPPPSTGA